MSLFFSRRFLSRSFQICGFLGGSNILPEEDPGAKLTIFEKYKYSETIAPPENFPDAHKKFARRWKMKSVGAALDFAIEFLPAFLKAISPMAFALFLRIGSPGEHENFTVQQEISLYKGKWAGLALLTIIPQKPK